MKVRAVSSLPSQTAKFYYQKGYIAQFMESRKTKVPAKKLGAPGDPFHTSITAHMPLGSDTSVPAHTLPGREAGWLDRPPLPLPGGSVCGHSRPSGRWEQAAAGHPCCLSELWSAGQTSPNLNQAQEHKDKVSHTPRARRCPRPDIP